MDFDNLQDLYNYVLKNSKESMENNVSRAIKEVEKETIQKEVLNKYSPKEYKRRNLGGIEDIENMKVHFINAGNQFHINIINETPLNPIKDSYTRDYDLITAIEKGKEYYEYPFKNRNESDYPYLKGRPFMQKTENTIIRNAIHKKAFKEGMEERGFQIS